jgi:hypothetical protein
MPHGPIFFGHESKLAITWNQPCLCVTAELAVDDHNSGLEAVPLAHVALPSSYKALRIRSPINPKIRDVIFLLCSLELPLFGLVAHENFQIVH